MFIAHAPAGYLTANALRRPLERALGPLPALTPAAIAGALAPDLDLLLWLADPSLHHHRWPTHWPIAWALLAAAVAPGLLSPRTRRAAALGLVFAGNGLLHQALDTVVGDVRWLAPFSDRPLSLFVVQRIWEPWWLNFLLHPSFALEIALLVGSVFWWGSAPPRLQAAAPSPPGAHACFLEGQPRAVQQPQTPHGRGAPDGGSFAPRG